MGLRGKWRDGVTWVMDFKGTMCWLIASGYGYCPLADVMYMVTKLKIQLDRENFC